MRSRTSLARPERLHRAPAWSRLVRDQTGQSVLEAAALILPFILAFLVVVQLAMVVVYRWEHNHLALQAARQFSVRWVTDAEAGYINPSIGTVVNYSSPRKAMNWTAMAYYLARESSSAAFIASTSNLEACGDFVAREFLEENAPELMGQMGDFVQSPDQVPDSMSEMRTQLENCGEQPSVVYTGKIPLMVPGAAHLMAARDAGLEMQAGFREFLVKVTTFDAGAVPGLIGGHISDVWDAFTRTFGFPTAWDESRDWQWQDQVLTTSLQGRLERLRDGFPDVLDDMPLGRALDVVIRIPIAPEPALMRHDFPYCGETTEDPCADNDTM